MTTIHLGFIGDMQNQDAVLRRQRKEQRAHAEAAMLHYAEGSPQYAQAQATLEKLKLLEQMTAITTTPDEQPV